MCGSLVEWPRGELDGNPGLCEPSGPVVGDRLIATRAVKQAALVRLDGELCWVDVVRLGPIESSSAGHVGPTANGDRNRRPPPDLETSPKFKSGTIKPTVRPGHPRSTPHDQTCST